MTSHKGGGISVYWCRGTQVFWLPASPALPLPQPPVYLENLGVRFSLPPTTTIWAQSPLPTLSSTLTPTP